jgi:hypothetical protein
MTVAEKLEKIKSLAAFDGATLHVFQHAKDQALINLLLTELGRTMEALESIRQENQKFADTAVMDWDGVQYSAYTALEETGRAIDAMIENSK